MSALDDRETHSSPPRGRGRQSDRDYFHRRSGQARDLLPKRDHRAFGKLYQRRIFRIILLWRQASRLLIFTEVQPRTAATTGQSFQTVFPPTIVRTARPFNFQPSNGELRESDWN